MKRLTVTLTLFVLLVTLTAAAVAKGALSAKGVIGLGADPRAGVTDPTDADSANRFVAIPARGGTLVAQVSTDGGEVRRWATVDGRLTVPAVAYDGSPGGLSADGATLVLSRPAYRFPQQRSAFTVLDARRLRVRDELVLDGTYTYDAISPDGATLYLIEYTDRRDPTAYAVRAYDLERGRLDPDPIVDPEESGEAMVGSPQTRAVSPDGRWAYTLYDSVERDHPPFIHALDTERGTAVCIDLDLLEGRKVWRMGLEPSSDGAGLAVTDKGTPAAHVDTTSFEVSAASPVAPASDDAAASDADGGIGLMAIAAGAIVLAGVGLTMRARRRPTPPA